MTKYISTILLTFQLFSSGHPTQQIKPVVVQEVNELKSTSKALQILNRDQSFVEPIYYSAKANGIDPILWSCVVETESNYYIKAKSKSGYKGLAQTPKATMKTGYEVGDLTYGSCILKEKLKIAKGDMTKALTFYKGSKTLKDKHGKDTKGYKQAKEVMNLYNKVKLQMKTA